MQFDAGDSANSGKAQANSQLEGLCSFTLNDLREALGLQKAEQPSNQTTGATDGNGLELTASGKRRESLKASPDDSADAKLNARMDEIIEKRFGKDIIKNLANEGWLVSNYKTLKDGFNGIFDSRDPEITVGMVLGRMNDQCKAAGKESLLYGIHYSSLMPKVSHGSPDQHWDIKISQGLGNFLNTTVFAQVTHESGPSSHRTNRYK